MDGCTYLEASCDHRLQGHVHTQSQLELARGLDSTLCHRWKMCACVPKHSRHLAHHMCHRRARLRLCRARRARIGTLVALMNEPKPRPRHL